MLLAGLAGPLYSKQSCVCDRGLLSGQDKFVHQGFIASIACSIRPDTLNFICPAICPSSLFIQLIQTLLYYCHPLL